MSFLEALQDLFKVIIAGIAGLLAMNTPTFITLYTTGQVASPFSHGLAVTLLQVAFGIMVYRAIANYLRKL